LNGAAASRFRRVYGVKGNREQRVIVENTETGANHHFSIAAWIPGNAKAGAKFLLLRGIPSTTPSAFSAAAFIAVAGGDNGVLSSRSASRNLW